MVLLVEPRFLFLCVCLFEYMKFASLPLSSFHVERKTIFMSLSQCFLESFNYISVVLSMLQCEIDCDALILFI